MMIRSASEVQRWGSPTEAGREVLGCCRAAKSRSSKPSRCSHVPLFRAGRRHLTGAAEEAEEPT